MKRIVKNMVAFKVEGFLHNGTFKTCIINAVSEASAYETAIFKRGFTFKEDIYIERAV